MFKSIKKPFSLAVCIFFVVVSIYTTFNISLWKTKGGILNWDMGCYHLYLPATFINHDLSQLQFYPKIDSTYCLNNGSRWWGIHEHPTTHKKIIKYTYGVALLEAPLFFVANCYCKIANYKLNDGYSPPYQLMVCFSTILFCFFGLLLVRNFLQFFFDDIAIAISLFVISIGTNLFFYSTIEPGLSHIYLFFLYALIINLSWKSTLNFTYKNAIILGFAIGLTALIRPIDFAIIIFPLFFILKNSDLKSILIWKKIGVVSIFVFIPIFIQMIYWKTNTGCWVYYSYQNEGFNFTDPHIKDGYFSFKKGWFVYTPLAFFGFLGIVIILKNKIQKFYVLPVFLFLCIASYITFSWYDWAYAGSFGCRAMIQTYAVLAFPLASLTQYVLSKKIKFLLLMYAVIILLGTTLNLFQTLQYYRGIFSVDKMDRALYIEIFGKLKK
jgi:hypothetical protein